MGKVSVYFKFDTIRLTPIPQNEQLFYVGSMSWMFFGRALAMTPYIHLYWLETFTYWHDNIY